MKIRFLGRVGVIATIGILTLTALAAPVAAATYCTTNATKVVLFTANAGAKLLYTPENLYVGPHVTLSETITSSGTFTASVTVSAGVKAEAGVIFAQASAETGIILKAEGSVTSTTSRTSSVTNPSSSTKQYVFFGGTRTVVGSWQLQKCKYDALAGHNNYYSIGNGTYKSWEKLTWGGIPCTDTPPAGTVARLAIAYCD